MHVSIGLLFLLINGLQAFSYYKFDIDMMHANQSKGVVVAMEKKFDHYHALKEFKEVCEFTTDCRRYAYVCRAHLCECADGYRPDVRNATCVGGIGRTCTYDNQCIQNAYCKAQQHCVCKDEYPLESEDKWYCDDDSSANSTNNLQNLQMTFCLIALLQTIAIGY